MGAIGAAIANQKKKFLVEGDGGFLQNLKLAIAKKFANLGIYLGSIMDMLLWDDTKNLLQRSLA